jgi:hypothetical protein
MRDVLKHLVMVAQFLTLGKEVLKNDYSCTGDFPSNSRFEF